MYLDIAAWRTLPVRQISSGLAETIKHACIASKEFFDYLNIHMGEIYNFDESVCEHIAEENCKIKYEVVMKDERENGLREVLNLGHTVGRAIETVSGYKLLHGEALAIGIVAEVKLANWLGYMTDGQMDDVKLPIKIPPYIDRECLVKKLYTDKKVKNGQLRFVIQNGIGNVVEFEKGVYAAKIEEKVAREIILNM